MAGMYAVYHGPDGLAAIARRTHRYAAVLAAGLRAGGVEIVHGAFFDTVTARVPGRAAEVVAAARAAGVNLRPVDADLVGIACDETTGRDQLAAVWAAFGVERRRRRAGRGRRGRAARRRCCAATTYLTHPVFHQHRSETAMLRYLRRLSDRDYALDRGMIPLGSCTMKLNATTEMEPITWPEFAALHPFAPARAGRGLPHADPRAGGLAGRDHRLRRGQPAAQRRLAGRAGRAAGDPRLPPRERRHRPHGLPDPVLRARHQRGQRRDGRHAGRRGQDRRRTATSTSADLHAKIEQHRDELAVLMVTYPSTHGVFEEQHHRDLRGGARGRRPGLRRRRQPQRAGRPGQAGPVRRRRLAPEPAQDLLHPARRRRPRRRPGRRCARTWRRTCPTTRSSRPRARRPGVGPVSAAPWGSAGILPISWAYVRLMGADGLKRATQVAVLGANYVAKRLAPHFPVLYTGPGGLVAHECIIDLRPLTKATGVTVDDVAKRLIDYGFHAPTMSFPVAGTLMIEPTESEDLAELDRFCEAMIAIRGRDRPGRLRRVAGRRQPAAQRAAHRGRPRRRVDAPVHPGRGGLPGRACPRRTSTGRRCAGSTARSATATWSAPARRSRTTRTDGTSPGGGHGVRRRARPPGFPVHLTPRSPTAAPG